jgi:glycosyltransferase involved in cell wall biosynthesis
VDSKLPVSVLIAVRNEAENIAACLRSLAWADEVVVVDSHSSDGTVEICGRQGVRVVQFDYDGGWPKKRNWALRTLPWRNEWVLILDADERVSAELAEEIRQAIERPGFDGYYLRWKFVFLGRWMKHCWSHGWMLRLFRRGRGEYEDLGMRGEGGWDAEVHENVVVQGRCGRLESLLDHRSETSLEEWKRKQRQFAEWNARRRRMQKAESLPPVAFLFSGDPVQRRKWLKAGFLRLPAKPWLLFVWLYVVKLGFLDGPEGYRFCRLRAWHEANIGRLEKGRDSN